MQNNVTTLTIDNKEIYIVGTAHVSMHSVEEVKQIIDDIQPDCICIELDNERFQSIKNPKKWSDTDIIDVIKKKKVGSLLVNIILSSYQKRIASKMSVTAGQEMMQAIKSAQETNTKLELVDRNIQTTFSRIWRKHSLFQKVRLLVMIISSIFDDEDISEEDIESLKQSELLEIALKEVQETFPVVAQVLIHERDQHLAYKIRHAKGNKIVAVVGAAHVPGIKKEIHKEIDIKAISSVPPKTTFSKISGWIIPALIIGLIIFGFNQSAQTGVNQVVSWILWNGSLSALGVLLAGGHFLSILTAFVAAPLTSLNPLLAAGWFCGLTEVYLRKPQVKDFERLSEDVNSFKGFFRNKVTHILLVVIFANLFSTLGTLIGGADILNQLF